MVLQKLERVVVYMKTKTANVVKKLLDGILRNEVVTVSSPITYQERHPIICTKEVVETSEKRENH